MALLPKRRSTRLVYSEAKHHQNARVWSRGRFIAGPSKETGGSCLKNPRNSLKHSANLFSRKDEGGGVVSYCKLVWVKSIVFEIKSCNDVPVNLHQMNVTGFLFLI